MAQNQDVVGGVAGVVANPSYGVNAGPLTASVTVFGPATRAYTVVGATAIWSVASTSVTLDITKDTGTTAPAGGSSILTGTVNTALTANTATPVVLAAATALAIGDRLSAKIAGTAGSLAGLQLNLSLQPA